ATRAAVSDSLCTFFFFSSRRRHTSSVSAFLRNRSSDLSAFHDETGRLNVHGMNIISNDGSNKLNRSRKARVSYKVQRTITASLNAATRLAFRVSYKVQRTINASLNAAT